MTATVITCRTCCRPLNTPYRVIVGGVVVQGCVAEDHTGHVADSWHNSPEGERIRRANAERLRAILGE